MGTGTHDDPLTRDDVLRRRDEFVMRATLGHSDKEVPMLSFAKEVFQEEIDLRGEQFSGIHLGRARGWLATFEGASLAKAKLEGANFNGANLSKTLLVGADLRSAHLELAWLKDSFLGAASLQGADLYQTRMQGSHLYLVSFSDVNLEDVVWGDHTIGEEVPTGYEMAEAIYRKLRQWYVDHGMYDTAGEFFYREMECQRKGTSFRENPGHWLWLNLLWGPLGYGEKPGRVVGYGILVWLLFAAIYFAAGILSGLVTPDPLFALYLSAVSFTAVGYGSWISGNLVQGWVQGLAAFESFVGVFMIAVFVTTFVRKMTR